MDVLLLADETDFEAALPTVVSFAQTMRRAPLGIEGSYGAADVAIVDARTDVAAAQRACRRLTASAPAIAVVAVVTPADVVSVDVDWGVDDVLLPAASPDELQARLRLAVTRRRNAIAGTLKFGDLDLHPASFTGSLCGKDLELTLTEFRLLNFLVQHAGRAFTRTRLIHEVWGYDCNGRVRTVDVHVRRLRAKLGPENESMINTVRGVGYMAVTPPRPEWIVTEPTPTPVWTPVRNSTTRTAPDTIAR